MRHGITSYVVAGFWTPVESLEAFLERREADGSPFPSQLIDPGLRPDQFLEFLQTVNAVIVFTETLSAREHEIFRRVILDEESQTIVAADLCVSKMAVSKAVNRLRRKARAALAPN